LCCFLCVFILYRKEETLLSSELEEDHQKFIFTLVHFFLPSFNITFQIKKRHRSRCMSFVYKTAVCVYIQTIYSDVRELCTPAEILAHTTCRRNKENGGRNRLTVQVRGRQV
jgi:hypothetical protein